MVLALRKIFSKEPNRLLENFGINKQSLREESKKIIQLQDDDSILPKNKKNLEYMIWYYEVQLTAFLEREITRNTQNCHQTLITTDEQSQFDSYIANMRYFIMVLVQERQRILSQKFGGIILCPYKIEDTIQLRGHVAGNTEQVLNP